MATYTQAAQEQISLGLSTLRIVETMELYNSALGSLYFVNAPNSLTATLEDGTTTVTFMPLNISATRPSLSTDSVPELTVNCDGIDGTLIDYINSANASGLQTDVRLRLYNAASLTAPMEMQPISFTAGTFTLTELQLQIKATFANIKNKRFPLDRYTTVEFPSLS